jgi:hypothetical protein
MLPCVPLVPQKLGVHLHTKDQLTKQYYGAKNKRNRFTRKKGKVPLSWRCGDASWVSWCHFGELCVTGCVLCDSLTWPSLQLKKETVDNQSYKDNMICLCKKKRGCWWWNGCADLRRRVGAALGQKERRLGQTLIRCCLYRNWSVTKKKNCPETALLVRLCGWETLKYRASLVGFEHLAHEASFSLPWKIVHQLALKKSKTFLKIKKKSGII